MKLENMSSEQFEAIGKKREALANISTLAAGALLCWLFAVYGGSLLTLMAGHGVWRHTASACLLAIPLWAAFARDLRSGASLAQALIAVILAGLVLFVSYRLAGSFIDYSWDGTAYHQQAILQLVHGWQNFPAQLDPSVMYQRELNHYPKAVWVIAASIYQAGSSMENAKMLHFVFLACAFFMLFGALLKIPQFPPWIAPLVALAAALNPVAIYQSLSFYVDGQLASALVITVGLLLLIIVEPRRTHLWLLVAIVTLTINIKLTGTAFVGLLLLALVGLVYRHKREHFKSTLLASVVGVMVGLTIFGFNPYITNTIHSGNPFYPVLGRDGADFLERQKPPGFDDRSGLDRLLRSTFSAPSLAVNAPEDLHAPFTLTQAANIKRFIGADIRLGGWGVLFSGALCLALLALPLLAFVPAPMRIPGLVILGAVAASVLINPEAWWARLAPQWYLVALIPAATLLLARKLPARLAGLAITLVLIANSSLVAWAYFPQQSGYTANLREMLGLIKGVNMPVIVHFGSFPSNRVRFEEAGIPFRTVDRAEQLPCRDPHEIFAYEGLFCVEGER